MCVLHVLDLLTTARKSISRNEETIPENRKNGNLEDRSCIEIGNYGCEINGWGGNNCCKDEMFVSPSCRFKVCYAECKRKLLHLS